ncbi:hypothetical protein FRB94_005540 [Tulasnella sp. JGI-2019a]|nr:hypothetical protein FRB93_006024 [Tulasnella sp. JGI-2019a]KAG9012605.1 hypothetical protein FRB94_005540 [Tulasnella sp. JGI-2019a]
MISSGAQAVPEAVGGLPEESVQSCHPRRSLDVPQLEKDGPKPDTLQTPLDEKAPLPDTQSAYGTEVRSFDPTSNTMSDGSPASSLRTKCSVLFSETSTQGAGSSPIKRRRPLPDHISHQLRLNSAAYFEGVRELASVHQPRLDLGDDYHGVDPIFSDQLFTSPSEMSFWEYPVYPDSANPDMPPMPRHPRPDRIYLCTPSTSSAESWAEDVGSTSYAPSI